MFGDAYFGTAHFGNVYFGPRFAPSISFVLAIEGETLTSSAGLWSGSNVVGPLFYAYQWYLDGEEIPGANDDHYQTRAPGTYTLRITISNSNGASVYAFTVEGVDVIEADYGTKRAALRRYERLHNLKLRNNGLTAEQKAEAEVIEWFVVDPDNAW